MTTYIYSLHQTEKNAPGKKILTYALSSGVYMDLYHGSYQDVLELVKKNTSHFSEEEKADPTLFQWYCDAIIQAMKVRGPKDLIRRVKQYVKPYAYYGPITLSMF